MRTLTFFLFCAVLLAPTLVAAQVPETISYQGVLTDASGDPLHNGDYSIRFQLFNDPLTGKALWTETKTVTVTDGLFSTVLGDEVPFGLAFDDTYWLQLTRDGETAMTPRIQLTAVPYALHALYAEQSGGGGSGGDSDWTISGDDIYRETGQVAVGTLPTSKVVRSDREGDKGTKAAPTSRFVAKDGSTPLLGWLQEPDDLSDGRTAIYGYRDRDVANQGTGVGIDESNGAVLGHNYRGDQYSFGVRGYTWWDNFNTGGVLGAQEDGDVWGSLGFRDENGDVWGVYTPDNVHVGQALTSGSVQTGNVVSDSVQTTSLITGDFQATTMQIENLEATTLVSSDITATDLGSDSIDTGALITDTVKIPTGASEGYVLTSGSSGVGTWQPPSGGFALPFSGSCSSDDIALDITNTNTSSTAIAISGRSSGFYGGVFTTDLDGNFCQALRAVYEGNGPYDAKGVYGKSSPQEGYGYGGYFEGGRAGVYGKTAPQGDGYGGYFEGGQNGVYAEATSNESTTHVVGVEGHADGTYGYGSVVGVYGHTTGSNIFSYGVKGVAEGPGSFNIGVYGHAEGATNNLSGIFEGDIEVTGDIIQAKGITRIDHPLDPENKYLQLSQVASPDMMNVYNGNVVLNANGAAWVDMPKWFEALNGDFRYQLTPIGGAGPNLHIDQEMKDGRFRIAGGPAGLKVSWQVTGIRQDRFAKAHRTAVELDKQSFFRGKYLHPELYGRPAEEAIGRLDPETLKR